MLPFFGALRISELVTAGNEDNMKMALQLSHLQLEDERAIPLIRKTKTNHLGKGTRIVLGQCLRSTICAVRALHSYMGLRG
ncbi:hypothetical protein JRQ81_019379, partial [Phrynocephalus forsythii]